jgi:hypothetical protein
VRFFFFLQVFPFFLVPNQACYVVGFQILRSELIEHT